MRKLLKWLLILILAVAAAFAVYALIKLNRPATTTSHARDFEIRSGEHAGQIADRLAEQKLIASEFVLELYMRFKNAEDQLQAGVYILDSNMSISEIVQILTQGGA